MERNWAYVALINFLVAAIMGLTLRMVYLVEAPGLDFRHLMHAHSHVAMLGWCYLILYYLIWVNFIPQGKKEAPVYQRLFWLTQASVLGMALSFPFQGYGPVSIGFTALHLICSYYFFILVWRDLAGRQASASGLLLRTALVWMLLSTVGVWALGPITVQGGRGSALYYMAIQFFLHFQFNGWFTFAALALLFQWLERRGVTFSTGHFRIFFGLLVASCMLTYALSVTWSTPMQVLFYLNGLGVVLQIGAIGYFLWLLWPTIGSLSQEMGQPGMRWLLGMALVSFLAKVLVQSMVIIPQVAVISYTIRQFVIGFIHLTMLGSISLFVLAMLWKELSGKVNNTGVYLLLAGFLGSELLLFGQGLLLWMGLGFVPYYYELIFAFSALIPIGILLILREIKSSLRGYNHLIT
ncbi:hypothetical protein QWY31_05835 [Cytophagales bacterium LB-30]|uniref:NnrS family protein n=1 Tax=Shiella aurantiaca TaxID=3058365 RepID=A0ABT8F3H8_9BACT|nr:hypothetical protein [Shiella aurantiaca]MDN4165013.1 hypothetical protein [Shiella aurantiaca]